jgi:hypothetical protein
MAADSTVIPPIDRPKAPQNEASNVKETELTFDSTNSSRSVVPADQLPTSGFMGRRKYLRRDLLSDVVARMNSGNLAHLQVPTALVYRLACLCKRWAPDLQVFIAQVIEGSGHLDHFLTQPAATDHHAGRHGLLEAAITAAELAMNADHDPRSFQPLPFRVDELQQVCAAAAFLFDIGKVLETRIGPDLPRAEGDDLAPYSDLPRCWRSSWEPLRNRHPVLAAWFDQLGRETSDPIAAVRAGRRLVRNAVSASWRAVSAPTPR